MVAFIFVFVICVCIGNFLSTQYAETNQLIYYFFIVLYADSLMGALFTFLLALLAFLYMRKDLKGFNIRKIWGYFFLIIGIILLIVNLLEVSKSYEDVLVNGDTPSKFTYKYQILLDALQQETKTENIPVERIGGHWDSYSTGGRSGTTGHSYYVDYTTGDNRIFSTRESAWIMKYVENLELHQQHIQIEYYIRSGVIKSIEGYPKNDYDKLKELLDLLIEEKELQRKQEQEAELRRQEEARKVNSRRYEILDNSIGRNIEEVKSQLEEEQIPFSREILYISSQMYDVNCIAFCDNETVYVVKDNLNEDMIPIPAMEPGMTREEIISVLTYAGFGYFCDEFSCDMHGENKLHTRGFSPGTLVPRGYEVWFSVDK